MGNCFLFIGVRIIFIPHFVISNIIIPILHILANISIIIFIFTAVRFSIAFCFGMLTFWFLEIQGFVILSMAIETVLGGQMFPLDLLPAWAYSIAKCLPFYYQMYFPAAIFTGRITDVSVILQGYAIQAIWVVVLLLINQALWTRGLRRHTAVGG